MDDGLDIEDLLRPHWTILLGLLVAPSSNLKILNQILVKWSATVFNPRTVCIGDASFSSDIATYKVIPWLAKDVDD